MKFIYDIKTDRGSFYDGEIEAIDKDDAYRQLEDWCAEGGYYVGDCLIHVYTIAEAKAEGFIDDDDYLDEAYDDGKLYRIKFRYHDRYTRGEWSYQECIMSSVEECIEWYGLNVDCDRYEILSVEEVK